MTTGNPDGVWHGLCTAIADELALMGGYILTRTSGAYTAGVGTLTVESTDRFATAGTLNVAGLTVAYTGVTATTFTGVTDADGNTGVPVDLRTATTVMDATREYSQLDDLRASFILASAEGNELDILGRNSGIERPLGMLDSTYRDLLQVMLYLEAQTMYACEQVLDIVFGAGQYELYEDTVTYPLQLFVSVPLLGPSAAVSRGKTYVTGGEPQTRATATTVVVDNPPEDVYGVYADTDPFRQGTNYANASLATTTDVGSPTRLFSAGLFVVGDVGRGVEVDNGTDVQTWRVQGFVDANTLRLGWDDRDDGQVDSGEETTIRSDYQRFAPWVVGHTIVILDGDNAGSYTITGFIDNYRVSVGTTLAPDAQFSWRLDPNFGTVGGVTTQIARATAAGTTITTPVTMPTDVLVDYVHVGSGQLMEGTSDDGNAQYPFYLWDRTATAKYLLDLITASGVEVVMELT